MKNSIKALTLISLFSLSLNSVAQTDSIQINKKDWDEKSLLDLENMTHGGYGALSFKAGTIDNSKTLFYGGRGGWIANHKLVIGLGAYGVISEQRVLENQNKYYYEGGYGGLLLEYILFSDKVVHLSFPMLFGGGWIGQIEKNNESFKFNQNNLSFLVFEPGLEVDFNISNGFRIGLGAYYSLTEDVGNSSELNSDIMNNLSLGLQLKWGLF